MMRVGGDQKTRWRSAVYRRAANATVLISVAKDASSAAYVARCMLHAARCTLQAARCMLHAACCTAACCMLHIACCTLHVARCMLHVARCTLHAARCMLHAARCTLHAARCTLHVARCTLPHACTLRAAWLGRRRSPAGSGGRLAGAARARDQRGMYSRAVGESHFLHRLHTYT